MKFKKTGRYGIDWDKNPEELTKEDYKTIFIETTKIIERGDFSDKETPTAFFDRGIIWIKKQNYQQALSDLTSSINLRDNFFASYYNRGLSYYYLGKHEEALKDFKMALNLYPAYSDTKTWIEIIESEMKN